MSIRQEQELSEDFYRQFKDKGVFLFLDGKDHPDCSCGVLGIAKFVPIVS